MDSGEAVLLVASLGIVAFLAFLAYTVVVSKEKTTVFVRDKEGDIVAIIER